MIPYTFKCGESERMYGMFDETDTKKIFNDMDKSERRIERKKDTFGCLQCLTITMGMMCGRSDEH